MISRLKTSTSCAAILSITIALAVCGPSVFAADSTKDVTAANKQFYVALDAIFKGDTEPMKNVWSHAKDVTYMGPDGTYSHGWDAVIREWQNQSAKKFGGHVDMTDTVVTAGEDIAVVEGLEKGQNKSHPVSIRATSVYRKEGGTWKMIGHHADQLPWVK